MRVQTRTCSFVFRSGRVGPGPASAELDADQLADAGLLHGHAVELVGDLHGLAGVGDLYVSAAGGRNSKMGSYLGKGLTFQKAKKKFMKKDTVEGEQLVREIAPFILKKIDKKKIPLMISLLQAILKNKKLKIN